MSDKQSNSSSSSSTSSSNSSDSDSESVDISKDVSRKSEAKLGDAEKITISRKKSSTKETVSESNQSSSSGSGSSSDDSENEDNIPKASNEEIAEKILVGEEKEKHSEVSKPRKRKIEDLKQNMDNNENKKIKGLVLDNSPIKENVNEVESLGKLPYNPEQIDSPKERILASVKVVENIPSQQDEVPVLEKIENSKIVNDSEIITENMKSNETVKILKQKEPEKQKVRERSRSPHKSKDSRRSRSPRNIQDYEERRDKDRSRRKYSKSPHRKRSDRKYEFSRHRSRSPRRDDDRRKPRETSRNRRDPPKRSRSPRNDKLSTQTNKEDGEIEENPNSQITARQRKTVDILTSRTGGAYIPPAKLRMLQNEITDKSSAAYQRIAWEALKKSIHGYINKVNVDNIGIITRELLRENIVRGRGLLCRSIIQAQAASPTFTHVYAALVAIINSKFPNIGELLLKRLVIQFKRGFRRNDKIICLSASRFIAHLVNQRVAHEILALEILTLLVETPTDDSVEVAIAFLKECGMKLTEVSAKGINAIFEMLKNILHEGKLDKRVQYMIEVVFQVRKDGFKDHQSVVEALELVEEEDQYTHLIMLDEATETQDQLNVFKFDDKYQENEDKYKGLSKELLGSDADESGSGTGSGSDGSDEDEDENDDENDEEKKAMIIDNTETNLIALRRTIYLTIHSSLDYEECAHKLMKMQLKPGQEMELCHMFLDCCAEQRTYEKFYGLLAQRFCNINKIYIQPFEEIFKDTYSTTHRLDTNRLRNVSKFFAHLLFTDAIGWEVMECIRLNEDDTTSSSRIFIKILYQELAEYMGLGKLNERLKDITLSEAFSGLFPRDNPRNTRFAINFFTSIGLGGLTDELREFLKSAPKTVPAINHEIFDVTDDSTSTSSSSSSGSSTDSSSSSDSESDNKGKNKKLNKKKSKSDVKTKKIEKKKKLKKRKNKKRRESSSSSSSSSSSNSSSDTSSDSSSSSSTSTSSSSDDGKKSKNTRKKKNLKNNKKAKSNLQMDKMNPNPFSGDGEEIVDRFTLLKGRDDKNRREQKEYEWGRNDNNYINRDRQRNENPFKTNRNNDGDRINRNDKENRIRDKPRDYINKSREYDNYKDNDKSRDHYRDTRNTIDDRDQNRYRDRNDRDIDNAGKRSDRKDEGRYRDDMRIKHTSRRNRNSREEYRSSSKSNRAVSKERG